MNDLAAFVSANFKTKFAFSDSFGSYPVTMGIRERQDGCYSIIIKAYGEGEGCHFKSYAQLEEALEELFAAYKNIYDIQHKELSGFFNEADRYTDQELWLRFDDLLRRVLAE